MRSSYSSDGGWQHQNNIPVTVFAAMRRSNSNSLPVSPASGISIPVAVLPAVAAPVLPVKTTTATMATSCGAGWAKAVLLFVLLLLGSGRVIHHLYPHAHYMVRDLLINQEFLPVPHSASVSPTRPNYVRTETVGGNSSTSPQGLDYIAIGKQRAAQSSVTFLGVAKDVGNYLPRVLLQVEVMASYFQASQAILIEGDSVDNTVQVMTAWKQLSPTNRTVLNFPLAAEVEFVGSFNGTLMPREGRLALTRNRALEELQHHPATDYIIMVDLDIVGVSLEGLFDSLGRDGWSAMCAHGVILSSFYRDTYAFRMPGMDTNHHKCGSDHLVYGIPFEEKLQNRRLFEVRALVEAFKTLGFG
jgi:hypothetical protein